MGDNGKINSAHRPVSKKVNFYQLEANLMKRSRLFFNSLQVRNFHAWTICKHRVTDFGHSRSNIIQILSQHVGAILYQLSVPTKFTCPFLYQNVKCTVGKKPYLLAPLSTYISVVLHCLTTIQFLKSQQLCTLFL